MTTDSTSLGMGIVVIIFGLKFIFLRNQIATLTAKFHKRFFEWIHFPIKSLPWIMFVSGVLLTIMGLAICLYPTFFACL